MKIGSDYVGISTPFYCHDQEGYLLMHKRGNACRDEQGRWDPGGGKLEFDLSVEENVLQEVLEEYCCKGEIVGRLPAHDVFRQMDGVKTHWLAVPFFVRVRREEVKIGEPEKMSEIGWYTLATLPEPLHTGFKHTSDIYRSEFAKYIKS